MNVLGPRVADTVGCSSAGVGASEGLRSTDGVLDRLIFGPVSTGFSIHSAAGFSFFPLFFFFSLRPPRGEATLRNTSDSSNPRAHISSLPHNVVGVRVFASAYVRM